MNIIINEQHPTPPESALRSQGNALLNWLTCLGYIEHPPFADLLAQYHTLQGDWLVASPIHWEVTHNDAFITAYGDDLNLDEETGEALFNDIAPLFHEYGFQTHYHNKDSWLLSPPSETPMIKAPTPEEMLHRSMMPVLSAMDKTQYWQKLLTEMQMCLSAHPSNAKRPGLPINGLWFYGGGKCTIPHDKITLTDDETWAGRFPEIQSLSSSPLKKDTILLLFSRDSLPQLPNQTIHWWWNNCRYTMKKKPWWRK